MGSARWPPRASLARAPSRGYGPDVEHKVRTVTRTKHCKVDQCTCGAVHISVGATTVRIKAEAARDLRDALVRAMAEIDTAEKTTTAAEVLRAPFKLVLPESNTKDDDDDDGGPQVH